MSLRVGIVAYRSLLPETAMSCLELERAMRPVWQFEIGANVEHGRNKVAAATQEDALLFVDSDMQFKPEDAEYLLRALKQRASRGAVSAAMVSWKNGVPVHNWKRDGEWLGNAELVKRSRVMNGIHEVDKFGAAFTVISKEALDAVGFPWFETGYTPQGAFESEDTRFCRKLQQAGFEPSVHFGVRIQHIGPTAWGLEG